MDQTIITMREKSAALGPWSAQQVHQTEPRKRNAHITRKKSEQDRLQRLQTPDTYQIMWENLKVKEVCLAVLKE